MADIRVVIFEDNYLLRESLFQLVNGTAGLICCGALANCDDLIFHIRKTNPDVVLMDIKMPGKTGIDGAKMITDNFSEIKVIMQTVVEDEDKIFSAICNGASGYLLKSTPPAMLLQSITEAYQGGAPMTPVIAKKVLEKFRSQSTPPSGDLNNLSSRENEVLDCLVKGMSYKMISAAVDISIDTVRFHIRNIYHKLHVNSKSEAVVKAIRNRN
jgi:DNA-binding NarL/FixJ family response regulator